MSTIGQFEVMLPYDPERQWREWGRIYEASVIPEGYAEQEAHIVAMISVLPWDSVLDVGCGFGRLGELVARLRPEARYVGFDVSADQIAAGRRRLPDAELNVSSIAMYPRWWRADLVLSAEVLMHLPPDQARDAVERICSWSSRWVVTCDWYEPEAEGNEWNFSHPYEEWYGDRLCERIVVDRQSIFLVKP